MNYIILQIVEHMLYSLYDTINLVIKMNLGNRIAELRKIKEWSQNDLANKIFVSNKTISSWESNRTEPNLETIVKLSELLDCNASYLIYGNTKKMT